MNIILENYLIIIIVGLFFVFALIGYLIDMLRNNNSDNEEIIQSRYIPELKEEKDVNIKQNKGDDLLKNYDETVSE